MANRFWVGGSGNWSDATNHWATTSGGAPGAGNLPTSADSVFFDTLSHTTNYTVTQNSNPANCLNATFAAPLANNLTLAGTSTWNIYGSLTLYAGMIRSYTGGISFVATALGKTITLAGNSIASSVIFNGVGGGWTLQDAFNNGTSNITLTNGALDTNGQTVTSGVVVLSNSNVRTLTLGATTWNFSSNWTGDITTNLTLSAGTSVLNSTGATPAVDLGDKTYYELKFTGALASGASLQATSVANPTLTNLRFTPSAAYAIMRIAPGVNITVSGAFDAIGQNNSAQRLYLESNDVGATSTKFTITCNGTVTLTNVDFADAIGAGTGTWSGTSVGNAGNNSGITFTGAVTRYWVHPAGASADFTDSNWSASSGGATGASMPLPHDTVIFDGNSFAAGGKTVTFAGVVFLLRVGTINFTGVTNSPTVTISNTTSFFGSVTFIPGMTLTVTSTSIRLAGVGSFTLTTATQDMVSWSLSRVGGTYTLQDAMTSTGGVTFTAGTFDANNQTMTALGFSSSNSNVRTISMGSGTWVCTGTGNRWNFSTVTNLTLTEGTSTIKFTNNSASSKTFAGGGETYNNFWNNTAGTGVCIITGSNTFANFRIEPDVAAARTQQFTAATTTTVTTFTAVGTAGNVITIGSVTAASHALAKAGGGTISCDYLSVSRSDASPATTWYAGANSTDGLNNTGWVFSAAPVGPTTLKTWNGIAKASVKTMNGVALASVKTWCGVA